MLHVGKNVNECPLRTSIVRSSHVGAIEAAFAADVATVASTNSTSARSVRADMTARLDRDISAPVGEEPRPSWAPTAVWQVRQKGRLDLALPQSSQNILVLTPRRWCWIRPVCAAI